MFELSEDSQFAAILDHVTDPIIILNPELDFIVANEAYCDYMGIGKSRLLSMNVTDVMPADYRSVIIKKFRDITAEKVFFDNIYPSLLEDGSIIIEKWHNEGVFNKTGELLYYACVASIQHSETNETLNLKDSDLVSNTLIKSALLGIIMAIEDEIIFINKKTHEILGTDQNDSVKNISLQKFLKDVFRENYEEIQLTENKKKAVNYEFKIKKQDGSECWVSLVQKAQIHNGRETVLYLLENITERKQNEIEIQEAKNNLSELMRIAGVGYWEKDFINDCWLWSDEIYEIYQIPSGTLITEEVLADYIVPASKIIRDEKIARVMSGGNESYSYQLEHEIRLKNNETRWLSGESFYKKACDGNPARFYGWVQDITEHKRIEDDLRRAKEQAEESDRVKTAFIANMSHEIRTPLNAILGFSDLLTCETNSDEQRKFKKIINQGSRLLLKIIDDVLDISTMESGRLNLNIEEVSVDEIFQSIKPIFSEELNCTPNNNISFSIKLPETDLRVRGDSDRIKQVLINLIDNAFKYTKQGSVTAGCRTDGQKKIAVFSVRDTGIGIRPEVQESIFHRFYQADSFSKGTGLGLAIARSLVEQMGGEISVESVEGQGSEFIFSLPLVTSK